ncbi:MAG: hypothetical protein A2231_03480 [Candidatus Firestonebacteria bacterium RIFOXYA2_FULL_40_8]|nr:MAG: hypothetical protein A2231_03480 [Candidatus Firestonebacteria bacterium RIFOXYA2_FULL_40_8]
MLSAGTLALFIIIAFMGGTILGLTGFGFALLVAPLFFLFLPPATTVPIINIISVVLSILLLSNTFRKIQFKKVSFLLTGGLIGLPFGIMILVFVPAHVLKIAVGIIIALFAFLNYLGFKLKTRHERTVSTITGASGGLLYGSIGIPGPPVILFLVNQECDKNALRANISAFLAIIGTVSIPGYFIGNLLTPDVIKYVLIFIIPAVLGLMTGTKLVHKVNEVLFKKILLLLLIVTSILSILSGFGLIGDR